MSFLYRIGVGLYYFTILFASLFNPKAKLWVQGRKNWRINLKHKLHGNSGSIWIHCASLGEFEQGRPIIDALKKQHPQRKILLTFFSPSGYEIRKNYNQADYVFYLPLDTNRNAIDFLSIVKPSLVFFIKYEFWFCFLSQIKSQNIPFYLVSANFRNGQPFFKWYGAWWQSMLKCYTHIFVQNTLSASLLSSIGIKNFSVAGDTRFDRVYHLALNKKEIDLAREFKNNSPVLIAGSTWPLDERALVQYIRNDNSNWKYIIAPHEIKESNIQNLLSNLEGIKTFRFSQKEIENINEFKVLIIDNIGLLSSLYQYGNIAYLGGGFGSGIHNTLEAAVYGMPIVFGPKYSMFKEAVDLVNLKVAYAINNAGDLSLVLEKLKVDQALLESSSQISADYVNANVGATQLIIDFI